MADQNVWYSIVRDAYAKAMGITVEQLLKTKNPVVSNAVEKTVKYLVDEDLKIWKDARQPPADDIFEMSRRAWSKLQTQAEKEEALQRIIDGR